MIIRIVKKLVPNLNNEKTCAVHIKHLSQPLKHVFKLKKHIRLLDLKKPFDEMLYYMKYQAKDGCKV